MTKPSNKRYDVSAGLVGLSAQTSREDSARRTLLENWTKDPWNWLTGIDTDGTPVVWTRDEREGRFRPYPNKEYLRELVHELYFGEEKVQIIEKSRQMLLTTSAVLLALHMIVTHEAQRILFSKVTEDESQEILKDKCRGPWERMPEWLRTEWPINKKPAGVVTATKTGSTILALAENSADREVRGGGASWVIIDEAAYQGCTADIVSAAIPMARKITCISTPMAGSLGGEYLKSLIDDRKWSG